MPWNLLMLPLVAGYYILTRSFFFKYRQQRLDKQRVIFESILIGALIGMLTYAMSVLMHAYLPNAVIFIKSLIPVQIPYTLAAFFCLLLAIAFSKCGNKFLDQKKYIRLALERHGNELELLLGKSVGNDKLLLFTLTNKKSYVGWVKELPIPSVSNYVRIIPAISGFRDSQMNLVFTNEYLVYYSTRVLGGEVINIKEMDTDIIIDMSDIITACYFDLQMYEEMSRKQPNNKIST